MATEQEKHVVPERLTAVETEASANGVAVISDWATAGGLDHQFG